MQHTQDLAEGEDPAGPGSNSEAGVQVRPDGGRNGDGLQDFRPAHLLPTCHHQLGLDLKPGNLTKIKLDVKLGLEHLEHSKQGSSGRKSSNRF